jgi:hypothetical protein
LDQAYIQLPIDEERARKAEVEARHYLLGKNLALTKHSFTLLD